MLRASLKTILVVLLSLVLASCGILCPKPNEVEQLGKDAVDAIQKPDAYYLKKCDPLPPMESESIEHIIEAVTLTVEQYRDICRRHDGLVDQVAPLSR